jgi:hypothetical protein
VSVNDLIGLIPLFVLFFTMQGILVYSMIHDRKMKEIEMRTKFYKEEAELSRKKG